MAKRKFPHIFIKKNPTVSDYRTPRRLPIIPQIPSRDRKPHGERLKNAFQKIWAEYDKTKVERQAVSLPVKDGVYLDFKGQEAHDLISKSLESIEKGIRLLNIRQEGEDDKQTTIATVYMPAKQREIFLKKITDYLQENTKTEKPKNQPLINSIEDIKLAILESFWTDTKKLLPGETPEWIEIWLSHDLPEKVDTFNALLKDLQITFKENEILRFPERTVVLARANRNQLNELIQCSADIAEMRLAKETACFWMELSNADQTLWVENLKKRLMVVDTSSVSVCLLDTGVNRGHELLAPFLSERHMDAWNQKWGMADHHGHGTLMAGIIIYGDLAEILHKNEQINIAHRLESVKVLPPKGKNPKHLYGAIIQQSISKAEIKEPNYNRIICLATTAEDLRDRGRPSSWSGAMDSLASGDFDNQKRLIILSAGNANTEQHDAFFYEYPTHNLTDSVHDPAQAWNAVTVGAYTAKTRFTDPDYADYKPLAASGGLSPFSTTSRTWERQWPVKPDILMEGGNLGIDGKNRITECHDLSVLTTSYKPTIRQFADFNQTSAATAEAARFAAQIAVRYPQAWPETIRALLIHSADWTETMKAHFLQGEGKRNYSNLLRICGYGVPSISKAIECMQNTLTLIIEQSLQPFTKAGGIYKTKDMHIHELPWPRQELMALGGMEVRLKVTLSYFIEPGPGEVGWKDKYRYASHGLRFEVKKSLEKMEDFTKRVNKLARDEKDKERSFHSDAHWVLGSQNRTSGSIHSDIWEGTAAELATSNAVAVFPVTGWWKERFHLGKWNKKARYSLVVSIDTPEVEVDIYTPVAVKVGVPVEVEI